MGCVESTGALTSQIEANPILLKFQLELNFDTDAGLAMAQIEQTAGTGLRLHVLAGQRRRRSDESEC